MEKEELKEVVNEEKSLTIDYFSTEIGQQLELYRCLEKKSLDLQKENERTVVKFIEDYKDQDKKIDRKPIVDIYVYNMMFQAVTSDMQLVITKIQYACQIALMAFGFDSFRLSDEDKKLLKYINEAPSNLFKLHQKKDLSYTVMMRDPKVYEIMTRRGYSMTPEDQKSLRQIYNHYLAEYDQYEKEKKERERQLAKEERNKVKEEGENGTSSNKG